MADPLASKLLSQTMTDSTQDSSPLPLTRRQLSLGALAIAGSLATSRYGRAATGKGTAVLAIDADPPTLNLGTTTDFAAGDVSA